VSVTAYQLIRYDTLGRRRLPRFPEAFFDKARAEREAQHFETVWGEWFGSCDLLKVPLSQIGGQRVVGVAGGRRTVYNLRRQGKRISGQICKQQKGGRRGKDYDWFDVYYTPDENRWYLTDPDTFPDEYRPTFNHRRPS